MNRLDDPIDSRVATYGFVLGIDTDDFKVFVSGILVDPVGVQYPQIGTSATDTFFCGRFERSLVFQLVDSLVGRLACRTQQD